MRVGDVYRRKIGRSSIHLVLIYLADRNVQTEKVSCHCETPQSDCHFKRASRILYTGHVPQSLWESNSVPLYVRPELRNCGWDM
jgi:hypothetical protein